MQLSKNTADLLTSGDATPAGSFRQIHYASGFTNLAARFGVVGVTGVEPVTLRLSSACSNQLSYTPIKVGGAEETRTPDL